jgi:hypothetical protein
MEMSRRTFNQRTRLIILLLYVFGLFCASKLALGSWLPPTSQKGLWFYSGLAALLLGNLLVTPFYTKPADAISYAVAGVIGLLAVNIWPIEHHAGFDQFLWLVTTGYLALILFAGVVSIALKDSRASTLQKASKSLYFLTDALGSPKAVFSAVFLFAIIAFHRDNPREYVVIGLAWAALVALRPLEAIFDLFRRWWDLWRKSAVILPFGEVVGHQVPNIVLLRQYEDALASFGDTLMVQADDGLPGIALVLDYIGFADGRWLRAIHLPISNEMRTQLDKTVSLGHPSEVIKVNLDDLGMTYDCGAVGCNPSHLLGLVAPNTDISQLKIEILRTDLNIEEGRLIEVDIAGKHVLYQIINGLTQEEILQQKNTRGYVRANAKKIGSWNSQNRRFEITRWIPRPNAPVSLVESETSVPERDAIGHFPGTNYPVTINADQLVTHNAAILGILGAGKSFLALELIERLIADEIKVICLDLTNQYEKELVPYYDAETERPDIEELQRIGPSGKNNFKKNVEEGGSISAFNNRLTEILKTFLSSENTDKYLKIFNPAQFEVWRQDSKPYKDIASMASLTPTEITRLITETTLEVLQEQGMSDEAKCCLVFEEAHSLIPEWTSVASEGDKTATNGTAKAILQGRKYGLGCLVITQRTANVTKSILNQCNTVFALRVFDSTGMEFLKNYIGEDYAGVLSTLEDRHAIAFGRSSSCRDPVLIRLNDRKVFYVSSGMLKKNVKKAVQNSESQGMQAAS